MPREKDWKRKVISVAKEDRFNFITVFLFIQCSLLILNDILILFVFYYFNFFRSDVFRAVKVVYYKYLDLQQY